MAGQTIPTVNKPKILGAIFDNLMYFFAHAPQVQKKVQSRNNVLKALAGTFWGKDKETIVSLQSNWTVSNH